MIGAAAVAAAMNPALDAALALDSDARARVARLDGASLAIHISGLEWSLYLTPHGEQLRIQSEPVDFPAATISGPPASLAMLATTAGTRVLFSGSLRVAGDVTAAKEYKRLFDTLDPDWEEALAQAVGDVPAHEAGRLVRNLGAWCRRAVSGRREDLKAWLVDEVELVPAPAEVDAWLTGVDETRADVDRMAARLARLERVLGSQDER